MVRRRTGTAAVLGINLVVAVIGVGSALLRTVVPQWALGALALVAFLIASALFYWTLFRTRTVALEIEGERIVVDGGRGGAFPLAGARVGPWRASTGIVCGSAIALSDGARTYRIGGVEHRAVVPAHLEGPMVDDVHVSLPAEPFAALLARVGAPTQLAGPAPSVQCHLAPNPSAPGVAVGNMLPWLATIVLVGVMSAIFGVTGLFELEYGQYVSISLIGIVVVGGLALTVVRSMRRNTGLDLSLDERGVRLHDARTGRVLATVPYSAVGRSRGVWKVRMRGYAADYPVVLLVVPGYGELSLCAQEARLLWHGAAAPVPAPRFLVGALDWTALVQRFELT